MKQSIFGGHYCTTNIEWQISLSDRDIQAKIKDDKK